MNAADTGQSGGTFTMDGAVWAGGEHGGYTLTKAGAGRTGADDHYVDRAMASLKERAAASGAEAEWAHSYLDAMANTLIPAGGNSPWQVTILRGTGPVTMCEGQPPPQRQRLNGYFQFRLDCN